MMNSVLKSVLVQLAVCLVALSVVGPTSLVGGYDHPCKGSGLVGEATIRHPPATWEPQAGGLGRKLGEVEIEVEIEGLL